ncbi:MAG: acyl-[ACP]--phospholipid O-acyltransferase [Rhodospirillales bacterium]|nr:acyl-[ACP]--phospholipid O-acyltransferase [Rhodospirillales bacterium]
MTANQIHLFKTRRFLPLFVTVFLGAANDNVFKNALVILVLYFLAGQSSLDEPVLITLAAGLFVLPFFLFSAIAGQLADKYEKSRMVRWIKVAEIAIMGMGVAGLVLGNTNFLLAVLFLMGTQSAFFGPVKYSILPSLLDEGELIGGNAIVEAGTFLAILLGTIAGGLLIGLEDGVAIVAAMIFGLAVLGWMASLGIPRVASPQPDLSVNVNFLSETVRTVRRATKVRSVTLSILGISWFWMIGATLLAQFPNYAKSAFNGDNHVVTFLLIVLSVGIGVGSMLCNSLLKGEISARYVPFAALGMTAFLFDLWMASPETASPTVIGLSAFLGTPANWRVIADLLGVAVCGGIFTVPLYAIMQSRSDKRERSQVVAGNNILNALLMVAGALAAGLMLGAGYTVPDIFLALAIVNFAVALYICKLLPETVIKAIIAVILRVLFRVDVRGIENYRAAGDRAVVVVNHVSFMDGLLIGALLPGKPTFAVNTRIAGKWWARPILALVDIFAVDPTNPRSIKSLIKVVRDQNRKCVIFPEGRITVTGALMKIYEGPGLVADKANAPIVPVRIDGAQFSPFSRLKGKIRTRLFPKITITVLPPRRFEVPDNVVGRDRRQMAGMKLYDLMTDMIFETCDTDRTLFGALVEAARIHGMRSPVVEDIERSPVAYRRFLLGCHVLGRKIAGLSEQGERLGVLLPNSTGTAVTFFAMQAYGRVPAMLNFSTGAKAILSAVRAAEIRTVLTSRRFIAMADLGEVAASLAERVNLVYLEDLKDGIGIRDKLAGVVAGRLPRVFHERYQAKPDDPAVVLFTSGSEGAPKGVVLSHRNILSNMSQLAARVDFNATDMVFNALPVFHSFGLTGGMLLPMLSGIKSFLYPSPLHYRIVPALVYDTNATIMFGTDTFLSGYARVAHPYDFYSLRYVFAGAEKVKEETRRTWSEKFGIRIFEGYGATETSPALSINTPMHFKAGTVGRLLPGIAHELEPVPGIGQGGRLIVSGPNVMLGYLKEDEPGVLKAPEDARYDTGDIVTIDDEGFVTIEGRAKRFAKIAGEMVSLGAVEDCANAVWPGHMHAVVTVPDARKGEQVVLVTDRQDAERDSLLAFARAEGIAELMVPKDIRTVESVPVLGTGKIDYVGVAGMVSG